MLNFTTNMFNLRIIILVFFLTYSCSKNSQKPLNVVWISCEDMGPILGSYGNDIIKTPNLDKLASEGVRYTNAYSTVGVCAPSRFSIITGMYPARLGAHNMRTGDYHNYKTPEEVSHRKNIGVIDKEGKNIPEYEVVPPTHVKPFTEILRTKGYYCANNFKCDYQFNAPFTAWDEVSSTVSYRDAPKDKPFFYVWNTLLTHESRIWERSNQPLTVNPEDIIIPSYFPDIPEVRNDIARKYSNIEAMDKKVGELMNQLEEDGMLDNTIIMFWSDHGGNLLRQKRAVGNSGLNVPLIIRYPNKMDAGKVDERIVSLMDLGPTVLSLLNIEPPKHYDGKAIAGPYEDDPREYAFGTADRFDESTDMQRSVLDGRYVYVKNFLPELPLIYRNKYRERITMNSKLIQMDSFNMLEGDAAYIFMKTKPVEEFYDLANDPYEVHNIIDNPKYFKRINDFRAALENWQKEINDQGFIAENKLVKSFWPNMIQPKTENVDFKIGDDGLYELTTLTNGASIGYQIDEKIGTNSWSLYHEPIRIGDKQKIVARAIRIGYKASGITSN
jgi:arylsulfatase A-like enzyme